MISSLQSEDNDGDGRETDTASCPQAGAYLVIVHGGRHLLPGHLSPRTPAPSKIPSRTWAPRLRLGLLWRLRSIRLSVCLSVSRVLAQKRCIIGLWLLNNSNRKLYAWSRADWQRATGIGRNRRDISYRSHCNDILLQIYNYIVNFIHHHRR